MEARIYHGDLTPRLISDALVARFNQGNLRAQVVGNNEQYVVQVATCQGPASGGQTALTVTLRKVEDGVAVQVGKQALLGVAASLGTTAFAALRNPLNLLGRLDDIAQDIENLSLVDQIWETINDTAQTAGASLQLSERLRRVVCEYCSTANPVGEPACIACGAPLGEAQPTTCRKCGFVVKHNEAVCPNCGSRL